MVYLQRAITSPSWKLKAQAASAIGSMATSLKGALQMTHRNILLRMLLDSLTGRTWDGKEHLLFSLASLCAVQSIEETQMKGIFLLLLS